MDLKKLGKRLLFVHPAVVALLVPTAAALLTYAFLALEAADPVSIGAYVLSFYALVLVCVRVPDMVRFAVRIRQGNRYVVRYASDVRLRVRVSLIGTFSLNTAYAVFQLGLGLWHRSVWFYAMAGYYAVLAVMRLMLARFAGSGAPGEQLKAQWRMYRFCGGCLLSITLALAVFILYFVLKIRVFRHHEITTIAMAAYTFSALGLAIYNAIRYRRYGSPVYSAAKVISLVSAMVSVLTLENAMFTAFGAESSELFRQAMLGLTGAAVVLAVQGIAVYMLVSAGRQLKAGF